MARSLSLRAIEASMRALIVDPANVGHSLAAMRALSHAGWHVGLAAPTRESAAAHSRWCKAWHRVPLLAAGADAFLAAVAEAIEEGGYEVVFASGDREVFTLSRERARLGAAVPYPVHERVMRAFDKLELTRAALRAGLRVPRTAGVAGQRQEDLLGGPVAIKPRLHELAAGGGDGRLGTVIAPDAGSLARRLEQLREHGSEALVQEALAGRLMAYTVVADEQGTIVGAVQQQAEATWPPGVGISARARTQAASPDLAAGVAALIGELGWVGLAQLQFIVPHDETAAARPALIDFNGRFYGSLELAVAAGVNLPALWAAVATGRLTGRPGPARPGVRYQWLEGDLRRARVERRGGLAADLLSCLLYAAGAHHTTWRLDDPGVLAAKLRSRLPGGRRD